MPCVQLQTADAAGLSTEQSPSSVTPVQATPTGTGTTTKRNDSACALSNDPAPAVPLTPPSPVEEKRYGNVDWEELRHVASSLSGRTTVRAVTPLLQDPPTPTVTPPPPPPSSSSPGTPTKKQASSRVDLSQSSCAESFWTAIDHDNVPTEGELETTWRSTNSYPPRSSLCSLLEKSLRRDGSSLHSDSASTEVATSLKDANNADYARLLDSPDSPDPASELVIEQNNMRHKLGRSASRTASSLLPSPISGDNYEQRPSPHKKRERQQDMQKGLGSSSIGIPRQEFVWTAENASCLIESPSSSRSSSPSSPSMTTIEAVIIDSTPHSSPRSLRHTEKKLPLRSVSSPLPQSQRMSRAERCQSQHRLVRRPVRITEQDRNSLVSEGSIFKSGTPSPARRENVDVIPVVVIPQRRSSLKFTEMYNKAQSQKPRTRTRTRTRARSEAGSINQTNSKLRSSGPPIVPKRSSSLSAPASRINSQATSDSTEYNTSTVDSKHHRSVPEPLPQDPKLTPYKASESPKTHSAPVRLDDASLSHLRAPPSTPSSPSLKQATAVNLFPHNNTSLLIVDPTGQHDRHSTYPLQMQSHRWSKYKPNTPPARTSVIDLGTDDGDGSPLTHPSQPSSKLPVSEVTPIDPNADFKRVNESNRKEENSGGRGRGRRRRRVRFENVRRAQTTPSQNNNNVNPESPSPVDTSFRQTHPLKPPPKNRKAGKHTDSKSDPFWRPRGATATADAAGGGSAAAAENSKSIRDGHKDLLVSRPLGSLADQGQMVFEGPPALARRSPELRRLVDGLSRQAPRRCFVSCSGVRRSSSDSPSSSSSTSANWRGLRYRVAFLRKASRILQRRVEGRGDATAKRERVKRSIVVLK